MRSRYRIAGTGMRLLGPQARGSYGFFFMASVHMPRHFSSVAAHLLRNPLEPAGLTWLVPGSVRSSHKLNKRGALLLQVDAYNSRYAMGVAIRMVRATRSNQISTMWVILTGIFVAMMQGTRAEKKMMAETETTPMTKRSTRDS